MMIRASLWVGVTVAASVAHADPSKAPPLGTYAVVKDVAASSTFADKSKKDLYGAWRTVSYDYEMAGDLMVPSTAWCEGKKDEGLGEGITINFAVPAKVDAIQIAAGVWKTPKLFTSNNQITKLSVSIDGGAPMQMTPSAKREWLQVKVGKSVSSVAIKIDGVKKGKANDSCISGVDFLVDDESLNVLYGLDATAAAALPAAYKAMFAALADEKRAGLDKLLDFPFTYHPPAAFSDEKLTKQFKHKSWGTLELACGKKALACPGEPNSSGAAASVIPEEPGTIAIKFPSTREIIEKWHLAWKQGAWKLTSIDYTTP